MENRSENGRHLRRKRESKPGWMVSKTFFFGLSCDNGILSKINHERQASIHGEKLFMYLHTRDLRNTLYPRAWSSAEAV